MSKVAVVLCALVFAPTVADHNVANDGKVSGDSARPVQSVSVIVLKTDRLVYTIGADGQNRRLQDPHTGKDYLAHHTAFMYIEKDGQRHASTHVESAGGVLRVKFGESKVEASVRVGALRRYLTFELIAVSDSTVSRAELLNLPLSMTNKVSQTIASARDREYAVAAVPLNIETHSSAVGSVLIGEAYSRVRLAGTKIALVGCPPAELLDRIERIELENGLPHPTLAGVWARRSPEQMRSYLFVDLSEATAGAMIDYAKAGGFGYIVVYDGVWNGTHGTYPVNKKNFPGGEAGLKAVSEQIHAAGLKFGMHNLDMVIDKTDALVAPSPAAGFLMYPDRRRSLLASIDATETFIPTASSPAGLLAKADKSRFHGRDLRIDDEIITYDDLQTTIPYGFIGCTRGAHGTTPAAHAAGSVIDNFSEFIDHYRPDIKSPLYDRVAGAEATALDRFGFDYIYPDGTGENLGFWPEQPVWYIYNLLISKLYNHTKREVMWGHAPTTDYSWHVFSRGNTTDFVHTGVIEHFDRVSIAGARKSMVELQPFEFGWFGYLSDALDARATRPREMQYAWSKALAYGAATSLETSKEVLDANGRTREIFALIRNWEELKLKNYFSPRIRELLKVPGKEFELERTRTRGWRARPVAYSPEYYVVNAQEWDVDNPYAEQPLRATIEAMPSLSRFGDSANALLLDPGKPLTLYASGNGPLGSPARQSSGVTFNLKTTNEFEATAVNRGPDPAGWGCAEIILSRTLDLRQRRALGTWVDGDGSGAYLHFVIEDSGRWSVRDYYVHLDFVGRRYVEFSESAEGEIYGFAFPYSDYSAIRNINFKEITRVYVFLSGIPAGGSARARFGRVEALQETPIALENPGLRLHGETIHFPVRLETGWYLEYSGSGKARVFDANGFTKAEVTPTGDVLRIRNGLNRISLLSDRSSPAKVTLVTHGEPLR
jgi:hypothetical protein